VQVALALVAVTAATLLWRKVRANGVQRGLTWDCGYAAPRPRMQYTGGSFAGIATGWFAWILQPARSAHRPRGTLPQGAFRQERIPETMLERVIAPMGAGVIRISTAVRRLQHGRLQAYILYVVAGIAALGSLVMLGGKP
jgi:hydrogenase-4 component B